jgi:inward rectifier potassium channel
MKLKHLLDTGFSTKGDLTGNRLLNKDGSSNIKKEGLSFYERFHLYHSMISMKLSTFLLVTFAVYFVVNLIFATGYLAVGVENLVDSSVVKVESGFLRAFFFSSQTLTTLGYGQMSPTGVGANLIATVEAFVGLLMFALLTGLVYGRFAKPRAKLFYSEKALVSPYKETGKGLMVRLANPKQTSIINVSASMILSYSETEKGEKVRRYFNLDMELDKIKMLATSWTLVHPITEESPMAGLSEQFLLDGNAELIVMLEGYDETYNQQVTSRASYMFSDVVFGGKFDRAFVQTESGVPVMDFGKLSSYKMVDLD